MPKQVFRRILFTRITLDLKLTLKTEILLNIGTVYATTRPVTALFYLHASH